jgi:hypothetical protein
MFNGLVTFPFIAYLFSRSSVSCIRLVPILLIDNIYLQRTSVKRIGFKWLWVSPEAGLSEHSIEKLV